MRKPKTCILLLTLISITSFAQINKAAKDFHQWASTPPMGWNSWDAYGPTVTESEVKANADYMSRYLKSAGWQYIVVDIRWYVANDKAHGYNETDPKYSIDGYGRLLPSVERFPSSADGMGFAHLASYIHSLGLKFGIHIMRGVPVIAVKNRMPVLGSKVSAADIYSDKGQCKWLKDMYTVDASKQGAQAYYNSLFQLYASWGVDFIKVDDLSAPYHQDEISMIRKAIDLTGRKIVLSTSPGETPLVNASHVQQNANLWRTVDDFWDNWPELKDHFRVFRRWNIYRQLGAWPDGDMLPLGHLGIRAERGDDRNSLFTRDEQYTLMTLWTIFRSPLFFGGDLPSLDTFTQSLITNKEVLDVLQKSIHNQELFHTDDTVAWVADDPETGDKYLALFNIADPILMDEKKAIWSGVAKKADRPTLEKTLYLDLKNSKKLYLGVKAVPEDSTGIMADWIDARIENGKNKINLSDIKWVKTVSGFGKNRNNKNAAGAPLQANGEIWQNGVGTGANSLIEYDIPEGYTYFTSRRLIDNASTGNSAQFLVFTTDPKGKMPSDSATISVDFAKLGFPENCQVRDLWSGKDLGTFKGYFERVLKRHGAGLYRISFAKNEKKG